MIINYFLRTPLEFKDIEDYSYAGLFVASLYVLYNVCFAKDHYITNAVLSSYMI